MKALDLLKEELFELEHNEIPLNSYIPTRISNLNEAIKELKELQQKDNKKNCEECYKETNKVLSLVEQREADAKHTIIKLTRELEELQNRSCDNCKYVLEDSNDTDVWLECKNENSPMNYNSVITDIAGYLITDFCCNRFEAKESR